MDGKALVPTTVSTSIFALDGEPLSANQAMVTVRVEEEANHIAIIPLAILPATLPKEKARGAEEGSADPGRRPIDAPFCATLHQVFCVQEGMGEDDKVPKGPKVMQLLCTIVKMREEHKKLSDQVAELALDLKSGRDDYDTLRRGLGTKIERLEMKVGKSN
ncbi:hypothetical protein C2845_PM03G28870 [Panicum miliaceum]|uniref:Uncharacterized protein n=1 Tax=Panicum miliaceum TaxID=4540 RepID=A0A3L6TDC6_PANMI|nr:hypothetical protein C2845_PM03G28870 [Panicum miliaceum]